MICTPLPTTQTQSQSLKKKLKLNMPPTQLKKETQAILYYVLLFPNLHVLDIRHGANGLTNKDTTQVIRFL